MTEIHPRQRTNEAYVCYLREMRELAAREERFAQEGKSKLERREMRWVKLSVIGVAATGLSGVAGIADALVEAYNLGSFLYAGAFAGGIVTTVLGVASSEEQQRSIRRARESLAKDREKISASLLSVVSNELRSYGMIVLQEDARNQFITTNQGIVTLATDKGDTENLRLLLNNEVLMLTYHGESRPMVTLQGVETNAPTVVRV